MQRNKLKSKVTKNGIFIILNGQSIQAANFRTKVIEEIIRYNVEGIPLRYVRLKVQNKGEIVEFEVPYSKFEECSWIGNHLGLNAWIDFKVVTKKQFIQIITKASKKRLKKIKTSKLGFQIHGGQMHFFYNGGSLAADGSNNPLLMAEVDSSLKNCQIPLLTENDDVEGLVNKLLSIAKVMPKNRFVGTLILAGVFRAILTKLKLCEVTVYFVGETGSGKTAAVLIGQACFGPGFKKPPITWESTPKAIELMAQQAACIFLLIDDFTKAHNGNDTLKVVERVMGSVGNGVARGYALSSTKNADCSAIEALPVMTGECIPEIMIDSRKARTCFCWVAKDTDFDKDIMSEFQIDAASGIFAKAIGAYIVYVLKNYDRIQAEIESVFDRYRRDGMANLDEGLHSRSPSNYADLMLGFHYFLEFCFKEKHLKLGEAQEIRSYHSNKLVELLNMQPVIHETQDIKKMALVKMSNYIRSNIFSLLDISPSKKGKVAIKDSKKFIGWVDHDNEHLYIDSKQAKRLVNNLPGELKKIMSGGEKTFWSNMERFGLLAEKDIKGMKNVVRKIIHKKQERVYSLDYSLTYTNHSTLNRKKSKPA